MDDYKKQRANFYKWTYITSIDVQNVIFTDEKLFTQKSSQNRQDTRFWCLENPYVLGESVSQGTGELMC